MGKQDESAGVAAAGGRARAQSMSAEARRESARVAALSRWGKKFPKLLLHQETHAGEICLPLGEGEDLVIPCAVLDGKHRVLPTRGVSRAMGSRKTGTKNTGTGAPQVPPFLASAALLPFVPADLRSRLNSPRLYRPKNGSPIAYGYDAELLPGICGVILDANKAGVLKRSQQYLVDRAEVMIRGFATVGIIALVDEATGFQAERAKDELQKILQA